MLLSNHTHTQTNRSIQLGNFLHKAAVLAAFASLISRYAHGQRLTLPLSLTSITCAALYGICWQRDALCKYQVASIDAAASAGLPQGDFLVLERRDDGPRKFLQYTLAFALLAVDVVLPRTRFLK